MKTQLSKKWFGSCFQSMKKGSNIGHRSINLSKSQFWHPLMSQYFLGIRHQISILDIEESQKAILRAFYIVAFLGKHNGHVAIINTNPEFSKISTNFSLLTQGHKDILYTSLQKTFSNPPLSLSGKSVGKEKDGFGDRKKIIEKRATLSRVSYTPRAKQKSTLLDPSSHPSCSLSYSNHKWVGGTLTNWKQVSKSVLTFAKFSERCEPFCIKNSIHFPRYKKIKKCFQGLLYKHKNQIFLAFQEKPDLLFILNPHENRNIINEANLLDIPIIALTQSQTDLKGITYPIPINNYSLHFIYYCLKKITKISFMVHCLQ